MSHYIPFVIDDGYHLGMMKSSSATPVDADWDNQDNVILTAGQSKIKSLWSFNERAVIQEYFSSGTSDRGIGDVSAREKQACSFVAQGAHDIDSFRASLKKVNAPTDNLIIAIQADSSGSPSGTDLITLTIAGTDLTTSYVDDIRPFSSSTTLTAGNTYWLVFDRDGAIDAAHYYQILSDNEEGGPFSVTKDFLSSSWNVSTFELQFAVLASDGVHVATQQESGRVAYHVFDPTGDVWTTRDEFVWDNSGINFGDRDPNYPCVSLALRSDGDIVIVAGYTVVTNNRTRVFLNTGSTWVNQAAADTSSTSIGAVVVGPDTSDRISWLVTIVDEDIRAGNIDSGTTVTINIVVEATADTAFSVLGPGVIDEDDLISVPFIDASNDISVIQFTSAETPSVFDVRADVSDKNVLGHGAYTDISFGNGASSAVVFGASGTNEKQAQSFAPTTALEVDALAVSTSQVGSPSDNTKISIQTDNSNAPSGTELNSITHASSLHTSGFSVFRSSIPPTFCEPNVKYWLVAERTGSRDTSNYIAFEYDGTGGYADGNRSELNSGSWDDESAHDWEFEVSGPQIGPVACLALDGTDIHLIYSDEDVTTPTFDLFHDDDASVAGGGTETEVEDAVTAIRVSMLKGTTDLLYCFDDDGTLKFGTITLAAGPIVLGVAVEADTSPSIQPLRTYSLGVASEADTAPTITPVVVQFVTLGVATEADTSQPITHAKAVTLGNAIEADTSQSIQPQRTYALGIASEADTGLSIVHAKAVTLSAAIEADTGLPVQPLRTYALGIATETDTGQSIQPLRAYVLGIATEADTGQAFVHSKAVTLGAAVEADTSQAFSVLKEQVIGVATEADTAQAMGSTKEQVIGVATEADTSTSIQPERIYVLGVASEADTAPAITVVGAQVVTLGVASEADTSTAIQPQRTYALGTAVETNTAQTFGRAKDQALGVAIEADTGTAISVLKEQIIGVASEADTGQPIQPQRAYSLGTAQETDTGQSFVHSKAVTLNVASEADTSIIIRPVRAYVLGVAIEADTAPAMGNAKGQVIGVATEADTAQSIQPERIYTLGTAVEADTGVAFSTLKEQALGIAVEADTSQAFVHSKAVTLGTAVEADTSQAFSTLKEQVLGIATEADTAPAMAVSADKVRLISPAIEADTSQPFQPLRTYSVGIATEADTGVSITPERTYALGTAVEADTAQALGIAKDQSIGIAVEADTGVSIQPLRVYDIGVATEADTGQPITPNRDYVIGVATEADTATALGRAKTQAIGVATETDTAVALIVPKSVFMDTATETDTALAFGRLKTQTIGVATEADTSPALGALKTRTLNVAIESDTAPNFIAIRNYSLGIAIEADTAPAMTPLMVQVRILGVAVETDTATLLARLKERTFGIAIEADTAHTITPRRNYVLGVAIEADTAPSFALFKTAQLGVATETDTALAMTLVGGEPLVARGRSANMLTPVRLTGSEKSTRIV